MSAIIQSNKEKEIKPFCGIHLSDIVSKGLIDEAKEYIKQYLTNNHTIDENGNMIFEETMLDNNDTLWLEEIKKEIKDPSKYVVLTFN